MPGARGHLPRGSGLNVLKSATSERACGSPSPRIVFASSAKNRGRLEASHHTTPVGHTFTGCAPAHTCRANVWICRLPLLLFYTSSFSPQPVVLGCCALTFPFMHIHIHIRVYAHVHAYVHTSAASFSCALHHLLPFSSRPS